MTKIFNYLVMLAAICSLLTTNCGREAPAPWPWWTSSDSTAVNDTLKNWRSILNGHNFIQGQNNQLINYPLQVLVPLTSADTISRNGITLLKIGNLVNFYNQLQDSVHLADLLFGVKNDTIHRIDTFCFVTYKDTTENCLAGLKYNHLWVVQFYVSGIDSSISPWDTTWRVSSITDSVFTDTQAFNIQYHYTTMRKMELKKDTISKSYCVNNLTGYTLYIPNSTDAPAISNVVLSKLTGVDTFFSGARMDKKGIYNPKSLDSLYTIAKNESITVKITASTPTDTTTDRNYFFVSCGTPYITNKINITSTPNLGLGKVAFTSTGIHHLYIEVIPASALFYPNASRKATVWTIPIRVTQ